MRKLRRLSATAVVGVACSFWSPTDRRSDVHAANLDVESGVAARMAAAVTTHARQLAARGESLAAFDERCIPTPPQRGCRVGGPGASGVAPSSNTPGIATPPRKPRAAGAPVLRRLARLGATPDFHHGLPIAN